MSEHAVSELHVLDVPTAATLLIDALGERGVTRSPSDASLALRDFLSRGHHVLVAKDGDAFTGYLCAVWSFSLSRGAPVLIVSDVFVRRDARRHGVASALLARAEDLARSRFACRLELATDLQDEPAQALYERHGFARVDGRAVRMKRLTT